MKYEEAYKRLDEISKEMENKDLPLEKAVELYSEAARLVEECKREIEGAKLSVQNLENAAKK
ncbi:MAG: exodeoxyribonuclease VII small subunit [Ruminiclostridium sp.]|nr:exodeoxyribonuclease VII small subunit [Ruminiclostridium sp.]